MDEWRAIVKRLGTTMTSKTRLKTETAAVQQEYGIKVPQASNSRSSRISSWRAAPGASPRPKADDPSLSIDDFGRDAEDRRPRFLVQPRSRFGPRR